MTEYQLQIGKVYYSFYTGCDLINFVPTLSIGMGSANSFAGQYFLDICFLKLSFQIVFDKKFDRSWFEYKKHEY